MEEIYIVKLKGLPPPSGTSQESLSKDAKNSFYYQDLTAEAIRGFSIISIFFGLTVLCLSVTNLCFSENPLALEPPLGITVWCAVAFLLLGLLGLYTAHKRRQDLSRSIFYVKVHFMLTFIVLLLAVTFVVLFAFDLHGPIANQYIGLNIFFSIMAEFVILLLTLFTCARVLWPGCLSFCAKDWPMQRKLKRKVIVKTNVFAGSMVQQNDASIIQSVGPNCVISLNMPPLAPDSGGHSGGSSSSVTSSPAPSSPIGVGDDPLSGVHITNTSPSSSASLLYSAGSTAAFDYQSTTFNSDHTCGEHNSLYNHSGVGQAKSYPFSSINSNAHMQTFRKDSNTRQQQYDSCNSSANTTSATNRLLYEHSSLFKMRRSYLEDDDDEENGGIFDRQLYGKSTAAKVQSHEVDDPYDTDEFDYCTTDDDDDVDDGNHGDHGEHPRAYAVVEDCQKSSSDEGNGTLEEDNKSSTCSSNNFDHHLSSSETDLSGGGDLYTQNGCRSMSEQYVDADHRRLFRRQTNGRLIQEEDIEENEVEEKKAASESKTAISVSRQERKSAKSTSVFAPESAVTFQDTGGGKATVKDKGDENETVRSEKEMVEEEVEDEEEDDEGIASSGSSTCSAELNGTTSPTTPSPTSISPTSVSNNPFSCRLRLQTYRSKKHLIQQQKLTPYKSSIRIESATHVVAPSATTENSEQSKSPSTTPMRVSFGGEAKDVQLLGPATTSTTDSTSPSTTTSTSTTPTIRLLTTKLSTPNSSSSVPPGKTQHLMRTEHQQHEPASLPTATSTVATPGKLSSHPYLCRLRAGNVDCFEKRYPKYGNAISDQLTVTTASSTQPGSLGTTAKAASLTVNFHEPNRVPDIQRV